MREQSGSTKGKAFTGQAPIHLPWEMTGRPIILCGKICQMREDPRAGLDRIQEAGRWINRRFISI